MAISNLAGYYAAVKQSLQFTKIAAAAANPPWFGSLWNGTGLPAAGSLAIGNTANGLVPINTTAGAMPIVPFSGVGYITADEFSFKHTSALARVILYDRLFHAGTYSFNSNVTLASQPSYSSRVPGGTDYTGTQLWFECVTAFTGNGVITVTYTDQAGNPGHSTSVTIVALSTGPITSTQIPLASGDSGISKIESVVATVASVGTFNLFIARPLLYLYSNFGAYQLDTPPQWLDQTGMPVVFQDSCLALLTQSTSASVPVDLRLEIASA